MLRQAVGPDSVSVLASPEFGVVPYAVRYTALEQRLGLDFGTILFLLDHIPLCLRGPRHAEQRADVARLIADRKPAMTAAMPMLVDRHFAAFAQSGPVDVLAEVVVPLVQAIIETLIDVRLDLAQDSIVSRVFSQTLGITQRRRLESELASLLTRIAEAHPDESRLRHGSRLALVILGRDALIGTVARSLHAHILALDGAPLDSRRMEDVPTHTGVPYIDREAMQPTRLHGDAVDTGDVIRCQLSTLEDGDAATRLRFFGAGAHLCLGRAMSVELFACIADRLMLLPGRVTLLDYGLRKDDVFLLPATFTVQVAA